jgi:tetratricopeptide (TPR) repeat protein
MKINQSRYSPWLIAPIVLLISTIGIMSSKFVSTNQPKPNNPHAYAFELNLPGTTDRKQLLQREIELYQTKLQQDPSSGLNLSDLSNAYWKMGKATGEVSWYLLAEETAKKAIVALPFHNSNAQIVLAQVAQARHDFKTAKSIAQSILKTKPNSDEARSILVTCALATGDLAMAQTEIKPLLDQSPNLSTLTLQALLEEAQGKSTAIDTFKLAIEAEEVGEVGPSALVRVLLGRHYYRQGKLDQAEGLYQEALRILPRYPLALMYQAALQTKRGQYSEADRTYDQVIAYSQQSTNIYDHTILRGKAKIKQLKNEPYQDLLAQAELLLRKETNAGHENGGFGHRRELAQLLLERNPTQNAAEALVLMQDEVKVRQDAHTWSTLAIALATSDRLPEARKAIESALKSGVQNPEFFMQAAKIEQQIGNLDRAKSYESKAKAIDSSFDLKQHIEFGF